MYKMILRNGRQLMGNQLPKNTKNLKNVPLAKILRRNASLSERKLRPLLNRKVIGFKFRYQHPVKNYILDFYCPKALLCVELDGDQHVLVKDEKRDAEMDELGIVTYRIRTSDL
jgi:very-short-patch-repair endonuclease